MIRSGGWLVVGFVLGGFSHSNNFNIKFEGVSVLNLPKTSGNSTGRDILVMFADLGFTFRILATKDVLNVMPIIANDLLKGTHSHVMHMKMILI